MSHYASPVDTATYGEYSITRTPDDTRPLYRFTGRISADGSTPYPAESGRYHLYSGWFCPWAHRATLVIALSGLSDVVGVSYVDGGRDGRGWAFRETYGPDPVNGFELLRDAYEQTEPGFDGHVSVPTLWDRSTGHVVSNTFDTLDIDLSTEFRDQATGDVELYPPHLRGRIDELESWLRETVNGTAHVATGGGPESATAGATLHQAFGELDTRLADSRYLLGERVTLADVRLWVTLVRYDAAAANTGNRRLSEFGNLWRYALDLYALPAFDATTDFASFGATGDVVTHWRTAVTTSAARS